MNPEISAITSKREEILNKIRQILISNLDVRREPDEIDPDTPLFGTGLGLDSVDAVELLVSLEAAFQVKVPDDTVGRSAMRTLNTLADLIIEQKGEEA
jgi:acyl carrier protein